jgi:hypothetical protein
MRTPFRRDGPAETISARFGALLGPGQLAGLGELVGVEHEYQVMRGDEQLDFRQRIHGFGLGQRHLDPLDLNAYRLGSGAVITADYREAEIATPPVRAMRGFARAVEGHAIGARAALRQLLGAGESLVGYSTHLNVSVPSELAEAVASRYARTFAPALILLMDRHDSPGLLIRPRPGRVELCGEYVEGARLRAAVVFAVGSVLACAREVLTGEASVPEIDLRVDPAYERFGWYVDRTAAGSDLGASGRGATLVRSDGHVVSAGEHLARCWEAACAGLRSASLASQDLIEAEAMAGGGAPLPGEAGTIDEGPPPVAKVEVGPFGRIIQPIGRGDFELAPVMVTWGLCVLLLVNRARSRRAFVNLPASTLVGFFQALDEGRLDAIFLRYLDLPASGRRLTSSSQAREPGLYDVLGPRIGLLPAERPPEGSDTGGVELQAEESLPLAGLRVPA